MLASIHVRVHTLSHEPNPAPSLTHSPPLVFDVVFGEPCLKKFFSGFEVAPFPTLFLLRPLLSSDSLRAWEGNRPVRNKTLAPHTLFTMCCTCELEKLLEAIVSCEIWVYHPPPLARTLWSLSSKSSSLKQMPEGRKVLMSYQPFIKHDFRGKRHSATLGMLQQTCRVSLWLLALQRHNYFKAFICR